VSTDRPHLIAQSAGGPAVCTHIRGTMIINSLTTLRNGERIDEYFAKLPAEHHHAVHEVSVQSWVSVELAIAHYDAMGSVYLDPAEQVQNGRLAAERTQNSHLRTVIRTLSATGTVDMWDVLGRVPNLAARTFLGGGVTVFRVGPKDGRIEFRGFPFYKAGYMHNSTQGTFQAAFALLSSRIYLKQDPRFRSEDSMALLISWV
jgi:hypothetical protein